MTATLHLPVCVRVCVCENAKLVSKYALKVSQRIGSLFFLFLLCALLFCDFCFYFEREQRSKAALQVCNGLTAARLPYAKFTQIAADNAKEERERERERARGRAKEQEKLKSL